MHRPFFLVGSGVIVYLHYHIHTNDMSLGSDLARCYETVDPAATVQIEDSLPRFERSERYKIFAAEGNIGDPA